MFNKKLIEKNLEKWHTLLINLGPNSNHGFDMDARDNDMKFDKDDILVIDIGLVIDGKLEGDYGESFHFGND